MSEFKWPEYLRLARQLLLSEGEAHSRTAISRAYYYMYHLARERAETGGLTFAKNDNHHIKTWQFYVSMQDLKCRQIGLAGERLKVKRNQADYDLPYPGRVREEAQMIVTEAVNFGPKLAEIPPNLPNLNARMQNVR